MPGYWNHPSSGCFAEAITIRPRSGMQSLIELILEAKSDKNSSEDRGTVLLLCDRKVFIPPQPTAGR